jgi:hypothetical protein
MSTTSFENETDDDVINLHRHAMDCQDCEDLLKIGIEAFQWIVRADQVLRQNLDSIQDPTIFEDIDQLVLQWLRPVQKVQRLIDKHQKRNFELDHLSEFLECVETAKALAKEVTDTERVIGPELGSIFERAIEENANGETSEFV